MAAAAQRVWRMDCYQSDVSFHRSSCSVIGVFLAFLFVHPLQLPFPSHPALLFCLLSPHLTLTFSPDGPSPLFFFLLESLLQTFLSFLPFGLHPLSLQLGVPQHLQTSKQSRGSCYHEIMRLSAPKLKEAIFCSCQLIIEGGRGTELFQYL